MTVSVLPASPAMIQPGTTGPTPPAHSAFSTFSPRRFRLAALLLALLLAVLCLFYSLSDRRQLLHEAQEEVDRSAQLSALAAEGTLTAIRQLLYGMEGLVRHAPASQQLHHPALEETLRQWAKATPYVIDLAVLDADGSIRLWSGVGTPPASRDRDYFRTHLSPYAPNPFISTPQLTPGDNPRWSFAMSHSLRHADGRLQQVLLALVDLNRLPEQQLAPGSNDATQPRLRQLLIDANGAIYSRSDPTPGAAPGHWPGAGRDELHATQPLTALPLATVARLARAEVLAPWQRRLALLGLLWLLLAAALFGCGHYLDQAMGRHFHLAHTDSLTGLPNRRAILGYAQAQLDTLGAGCGGALLLIDVDHFKRFNDSHGHAVGDEVLRQVSHTLLAESLHGERAGRLGGEEFLMVLPDTPAAAQWRRAEDIRQAVAAIPLSAGPVTVSIGLAALLPGEGAIEHTLARADAALYAAKRSGRNCVREAELSF